MSNQGSESAPVLNRTIAYCEYVTSSFSKSVLWFNRETPPPIVPIGLADYYRGRHYISAKQAPSALALKHAGSTSIWRSRDLLLRAKAPLEEVLQDGSTKDFTLKDALSAAREDASVATDSIIKEFSLASDNRIQTPEMESDTETSEEEDDSDSETSSKGGKTLDEPIQPARRKRHVRMKYDDPWKIHAGIMYAEATGRERPSIISWPGDNRRIQDRLPPHLFGVEYANGHKNAVHFSRVTDMDAKFFLIRNHTHWGYLMTSWKNDKTCKEHAFAKNLQRRIYAFLRGKSDPLWSETEKEQLWVSETLRNPTTRSRRFIEMLKTIDGIFLSRYLAFPEEVWNWSKFDRFVLHGISSLIGDEFLDGELRPKALEIRTNYSELKRARKLFKQFSNEGKLPDLLVENEIPSWIRPMLFPVWEQAIRLRGKRHVFVSGILAQTRGCGQPPPLVSLQSKEKFLRTVTAKSRKYTQTRRMLIENSLDKVLADLPQEAFTGLATKARISVTASASWENTRTDGGTAETIREIVAQYSAEDPVPIFDLHTGERVGLKSPAVFETSGELIFAICLNEVLTMDPEDLQVAFLTTVNEPGKARSVTKARACLKIVLDVISKICAWPLKKGIESSRSGMGQSHHGWNFFLSFFTEEWKKEFFSLESREEISYGDYVERTDIYEDLFVSSTDFETATDAMEHEFASISADRWMRKVGIPPLLQGIVHATCFRPRTIYFAGSGCLEQYGIAAPEMGDHIRKVTLEQGILMGDPLTKIVLHMTNIVSRDIGSGIHDPEYLHAFANSFEAAEAYADGLKSHPA
jgi:hypothetical protein